jgi:hypothetical protein
MSKVVKGVGRAVSKVVKGATKAVSNVVKGVGKVAKKIVKSKIGKVIIGAVALYFGVPLIAGAIGGATAGAAAGSGFWGTLSGAVSGAGSGAMAGLSQAWGGLVGATKAIVGGQGLSAAGQSLAGGFSPSAAFSAGSSSVGVLAPATAAPAANATTVPPANTPTVPAAGKEAGGLLSSPLAQAAAVQGVSSVVGAIGQGKMEEAKLKREERLAEEERQRRNRNMGVLFDYGNQRPEGYYRPSSFVAEFAGGAR